MMVIRLEGQQVERFFKKWISFFFVFCEVMLDLTQAMMNCEIRGPCRNYGYGFSLKNSVFSSLKSTRNVTFQKNAKEEKNSPALRNLLMSL